MMILMMTMVMTMMTTMTLMMTLLTMAIDTKACLVLQVTEIAALNLETILQSVKNRGTFQMDYMFLNNQHR